MFEAARWSPYAVGIGIGVLSWFAFLLSDRPIGCSTAFTRTSGMIVRIFAGRRMEKHPYYLQFKPEIDWQWMLVLGIVAGAFLSAHLSGQFSFRWVPERWSLVVGPSRIFRVLAAFAGGAIMGLGARWAGGCTNGHGISGVFQLSVASWIAAICFFITGIATAMTIF